MTESLLDASPVQVETPAARVLRVRMTIGLRQIDLARMLGVSERTVKRWESGKHIRKVYLDRMDDMLRVKERTGDAITQA
jgi:DNA-binding transcriptional regulator YiaG